MAESVLPTVAELAKTLGLEVTLFRAYHIPYNAYAGDEGFYAVDYDDLIAGVRDEANEYLEKKVAEMKKLGVEKVSGLSKEGFAGDEIIAIGAKDPGGFDRHELAWALGRAAFCARQRDRNRGAPY